MAKKKLKLRLIVDVEYDPHGVPEKVLADMLTAIPECAAGEGLFTGSLAAEVASWTYRVERV